MMKNRLFKGSVVYLVVLLILGACMRQQQLESNPTTINETTTTAAPSAGSETESAKPKESDDDDDKKTSDDTTKRIMESGTASAIGGLATTQLKIDKNQAWDIFVNAHPGSKLEEMELKYDDGKHIDGYYYEVEGQDAANEYKMRIDAQTGVALEDRSEELDDDNEVFDVTAAMLEGSIYEKAQAAVKGPAFVKSWELKKDDNRLKYKVELRVNNEDKEVKLDAVTGEVLEVD